MISADVRDYEEIRVSCLNVEDSLEESSWSENTEKANNENATEATENAVDAIHYDTMPVNEYENSMWIPYENYLRSDGYEEAVYSPERKSGSSDSSQDLSQDGYEVPVKAENVITYDIVSKSSEELMLFVETDKYAPF